MLGIGGLRIVEGALTIGGLVALQALLASLVEPVNALVQQAGVFQTIQGSLMRVEDVFNYPARPPLVIKAAPSGMPPKLSGRVELRNVSFGYSPLDPPLIEDFSLVIEPGLPGRAGRSFRQREIDARPSDQRALQTLVRRNSHRPLVVSVIPQEIFAIPWPMSIRRYFCSREPRGTISRSGTKACRRRIFRAR